MKNHNIITMNDHPLKTVFAIITGSYFGISTWISGTHFPLDIPSMFSLEALLVFLISCTKAVIIGCCSWAGASIAGWGKKKMAQIHSHFKNKK